MPLVRLQVPVNITDDGYGRGHVGDVCLFGKHLRQAVAQKTTHVLTQNTTPAQLFYARINIAF
jgi:hypothetical protein